MVRVCNSTTTASKPSATVPPPSCFAVPTPKEWETFCSPFAPLLTFLERFSHLEPYRLYVQGSYCWSLGSDWFERSAKAQGWNLSATEKEQLTISPHQDIDFRLEFDYLSEEKLDQITALLPGQSYYRTPKETPFPYLIYSDGQYDFTFIGYTSRRALATAEELFIPLDGGPIEGHPSALKHYHAKIRVPHAYDELEWKKLLVSVCRGWLLEDGTVLKNFTIDREQVIPLLMQAAHSHKLLCDQLLMQSCFLFPEMTDGGPFLKDPLYIKALEIGFSLPQLNALVALQLLAQGKTTEAWGSWTMVRTDEGLAVRVDWAVLDTIETIPEELLPCLSFQPLAQPSLLNYPSFQNFLLRGLAGTSACFRHIACQLLNLDPQSSPEQWIVSLLPTTSFAGALQRRLWPTWSLSQQVELVILLLEKKYPEGHSLFLRLSSLDTLEEPLLKRLIEALRSQSLDPTLLKALEIRFPLPQLNALVALQLVAQDTTTEARGSRTTVRTDEELALRVDWKVLDTIETIPEELLPCLSFQPLAQSSLWAQPSFQNFLLRGLTSVSTCFRHVACQLLHLNPQSPPEQWIVSLLPRASFAGALKRHLWPTWPLSQQVALVILLLEKKRPEGRALFLRLSSLGTLEEPLFRRLIEAICTQLPDPTEKALFSSLLKTRSLSPKQLFRQIYHLVPTSFPPHLWASVIDPEDPLHKRAAEIGYPLEAVNTLLALHLLIQGKRVEEQDSSFFVQSVHGLSIRLHLDALISIPDELEPLPSFSPPTVTPEHPLYYSFLLRGLKSSSPRFREVVCSLLEVDARLSNEQLILPLAASPSPLVRTLSLALRQEQWRQLKNLQQARLVCLLMEKNPEYVPLFLKLKFLAGIKKESAERLVRVLATHANFYLVEHALRLQLFTYADWSEEARACYLSYLPQALRSESLPALWKSKFSSSSPLSYDQLTGPCIEMLLPHPACRAVAYEYLSTSQPSSVMWQKHSLEWIKKADLSKDHKEVQHLLAMDTNLEPLEKWKLLSRIKMRELPLTNFSKQFLAGDCLLEGNELLTFIYTSRLSSLSDSVKKRALTTLLASPLHSEEDVLFWSSVLTPIPASLCLHFAAFYNQKKNYKCMKEWFLAGWPSYQVMESLPYLQQILAKEGFQALSSFFETIPSDFYKDPSWNAWAASLFSFPTTKPAPWLIMVASSLNTTDENTYYRLTKEVPHASQDQLFHLLTLLASSTDLSLKLTVFERVVQIEDLQREVLLYFYAHIVPYFPEEADAMTARAWDAAFACMTIDELLIYYSGKFKLPSTSSSATPFSMDRCSKLLACISSMQPSESVISSIIIDMSSEFFGNPLRTWEGMRLQLALVQLLLQSKDEEFLNSIPPLLSRALSFPVLGVIKDRLEGDFFHPSLKLAFHELATKPFEFSYQKTPPSQITDLHKAVKMAAGQDLTLLPVLQQFLSTSSIDQRVSLIRASLSSLQSMEIKVRFLQEIARHVDLFSANELRDKLMSILHQQDLYILTPQMKKHLNILFAALVKRSNNQDLVFDIFKHPKASTIPQLHPLMVTFWIHALSQEQNNPTSTPDSLLTIFQRAIYFFNELPHNDPSVHHSFQKAAYPVMIALASRLKCDSPLTSTAEDLLYYSLIGPCCDLFLFNQEDTRYSNFIVTTLKRLKVEKENPPALIAKAAHWVSEKVIGPARALLIKSGMKTIKFSEPEKKLLRDLSALVEI